MKSKTLTSRQFNKMCLVEMNELSMKKIPVSEDVYIRLATNTQEHNIRKHIVNKYGYYRNITFYSDGSVIKTAGPGVIGAIRMTIE